MRKEWWATFALGLALAAICVGAYVVVFFLILPAGR